ncbi:MAG: SRPBCC domain-containing protein [Thermoplasmata archaeon]
MCRPVHHEVEFEATPRELYDAYLDSRRHARITGQSAHMSRSVGSKFSAGDTYISGYNLDLIPARRIVQAWRASEWPPGAFSILRIDLQRRGKATRLVVDHVGIPDKFRDGVDKGWFEFYWEPMKRYFQSSDREPAKRSKKRK